MKKSSRRGIPETLYSWFNKSIGTAKHYGRSCVRLIRRRVPTARGYATLESEGDEAEEEEVATKKPVIPSLDWGELEGNASQWGDATKSAGQEVLREASHWHEGDFTGVNSPFLQNQL
jgi:hypothetical protein